MKRFILGSGASGQAALALTQALGEAATVATDADCRPETVDWAAYDLVVVSPGVRPESPLLQAALAHGLPVVSELEYGARHYGAPMLAVTGTNGKTTTVELTVHLLRALYDGAVREAGNIGTPLSEIAAAALTAGETPPLAVVEVSSFQLERSPTFAPHAAVLLNIASDHLDRYHHSLEEYAQVKYRIFDRVSPANRIAMHGLSGGAAPRFHCRDGVIHDRERPLFRLAETQLAGPHNVENLLAALELCSRVLTDGAMSSDALRRAVAAFRTGRHRLEVVAEFRGVTCVNDSKATNPASVAAALQTLARPVRLLLGGLDKGMDFGLLRDYAPQIRRAYLIGRARDTIAAALGDVVDCVAFDDFEAAVRAMIAEAHSGEVVLLSPACASMDMFRNYEERGDRFRAVCQALAADNRGAQ